MSAHSVQDLPLSRKVRKGSGPDQRLALGEPIQRATQQGKLSSATGTAVFDVTPVCLCATEIATQAFDTGMAFGVCTETENP